MLVGYEMGGGRGSVSHSPELKSYESSSYYSFHGVYNSEQFDSLTGFYISLALKLVSASSDFACPRI